MRHTTELLAVPPSVRGQLYPALPRGCNDLEASQYVCVPTPSALPYVPARWIPVGSFGRGAAPGTRRLIDAILLPEWAVLALLCFLHAARDCLQFFTSCLDPRLASQTESSPASGARSSSCPRAFYSSSRRSGWPPFSRVQPLTRLALRPYSISPNGWTVPSPRAATSSGTVGPAGPPCRCGMGRHVDEGQRLVRASAGCGSAVVWCGYRLGRRVGRGGYLRQAPRRALNRVASGEGRSAPADAG